MCGLFGYVSADSVPPTSGGAALSSLAHRGPDQEGSWSAPGIYVGHRRLSILDLSERGRQPFVSDDRAIVVTVNGEIYNFASLRTELSAHCAFRSTSDSEVVLHGFRQWGIQKLLDRIEGMYALTILDVRARRLFLARDRVGIKPLYFSTVGKKLAWASELKALELFHAGELQVEPTALYDFLTYLYVPTPKTLYRNVFKLEPAHYLEVDVDAASVVQRRRYWALQVGGCEDDLGAAAERLRHLIHSAVATQLCSDVPVGFFLSGGMDSSVVVCEAAAAGEPLNTYSIGFEDADHDETSFAQLVADRFATHHRTRVLPRQEVTGRLTQLRSWFDEPFADTSAFPSHMVSAFARETCKVVLTGDGGDEVFGGYSWYTRFNRHLRRTALPRNLLATISGIRGRFRSSFAGRLANRLELGMLDELELHTRLLGGLLRSAKRDYAAVFGIPADYDDYWYFRSHYRHELPTITRLQYLDFHTYLPDDILTKVDRVSMSVALEARVPLLATRVVEYAFSLPESIRLHGGQGKGLLKHAYTQHLPAQTIERAKKGFSIPAKSYVGQFVPAGRTKQEVVLNELFMRTQSAA